MSKRKKRWAALLVGLALMSAALWQFNRRTANSLLDHATQITSTANWQRRNQRIPESVSYAWLSDHEILYCGSATRNGYSVCRQEVRPDRPPPILLGTIPPQSYPIRVSPDGKWLLWWKQAGLRHEVPGATALNGSRTVTREATWGHGGSWLPDSRRWITVPRNWIPSSRKQPLVAEIRSIDRPSVTVVPLAGIGNACDVLYVLGFTPQGHVIGALDKMGFMQPDPAHGLPGFNYPAKQFVEFDIGPQAAPPRFFTVRVPPGASAGFALLSPQGDRLAWDVRSEEMLTPQTWLHRLIPAYKLTPHIVQHWWVSRLDGSAMHEIGRFGYYETGRGLALPDGFQWTPDGKRLSFVYKETLYTVPANR